MIPTRQMSNASGSGIRAPVPRTRTGCLTCRKRKVKCDERHPTCTRCMRLQRNCTWSENMQVVEHRRQRSDSCSSALEGNPLSGQNFIIELPNIDRATVPYVHHYVTFCSRFLAYSNDNEGNPFREELFPHASTSVALLNAIAALAAGHLARSQKQHVFKAANYYSLALRELNATLSDPVVARADCTLGACLLLCVYEISHADNSSLWLEHLQGARDLIQFRGGPKAETYLTRFFSFLDISGSLLSGNGPLLPGSYWLASKSNDDRGDGKPAPASWPYYDKDGLMVDHFHELMVFMADLARLSAKSLTEIGSKHHNIIVEEAQLIHKELRAWWSTVPSALRDQSNDWRRQSRPRKLTLAETLEEESLSSTKTCLQGCIIFLHHLQDPLQLEPTKQEVLAAVTDILDIANEIPPGFGLEMGIYWGLFMAGVTVFNDVAAEVLIREKMRADGTSSIYHADRALELLEVLWRKQHQFGTKYDWRQVQIEMGVQIFILA